MEKNYYEIMEVNEKASQEVIERVYKLLAKKYHPDLQESDKEYYAEKFKKLNEAYEVLSDKSKREDYDKTLRQDYISKDEYSKLFEENRILRNEISRYRNINEEQNYEIPNQEGYNKVYQQSQNTAYQENMQQQAYQQNNVNNQRRMTRFEYYKYRLSEKMKTLIAILIVALVIFIAAQLPFVKRAFYTMYLENPVIKSIVDVIAK